VKWLRVSCKEGRQLDGSRHSEKTWPRKQPLLEAVTRQLPLKTPRAGEDLACALVIY
jgi:hypothetical protein